MNSPEQFAPRDSSVALGRVRDVACAALGAYLTARAGDIVGQSEFGYKTIGTFFLAVTTSATTITAAVNFIRPRQ